MEQPRFIVSVPNPVFVPFAYNRYMVQTDMIVSVRYAPYHPVWGRTAHTGSNLTMPRLIQTFSIKKKNFSLLSMILQGVRDVVHK